MDSEGAGDREPEAMPEKKPEVAEARYDERLVGRVDRGSASPPEADQQIGAEADQFPARHIADEAFRDDEAEHRRRKETR